MGSVSLKIGDGTARFRRSTLCSSLLHLVMLSSVLATNLFALYAFTYSNRASTNTNSSSNNISSVLSQHISSILREIELSEHKLHQIESDLAGYSTLDPTSPKLPPELKLFLSRHPLPLGRDSKSGITEMVSSVAHSCSKSPDLLSQFMAYKPFSPCPVTDSHLPQKLISRGCEPLPRRRCLSRPKSRSNPKWVAGKIQSWVKPRGKNDFLADDVPALGGAGSIRIGFDFGSSATGEFAAVMAERNVTVVTASHLSETIEGVASKGVFPLMMSSAMRFPFYDGVFDLVHTTKGLDEGGAEGMGMGKAEAMEFLMFDVDRVLRAGGLFWLDNYLCVHDERKRVVTRLIERFGYKKLKWVVGEKADSAGKGKACIYRLFFRSQREGEVDEWRMVAMIRFGCDNTLILFTFWVWSKRPMQCNVISWDSICCQFSVK